MKVEFGYGGVGVGVETHFHAKPNFVELLWGCVEVELGLWQNGSPYKLLQEKFSTCSITLLHKGGGVQNARKLKKLSASTGAVLSTI